RHDDSPAARPRAAEASDRIERENYAAARVARRCRRSCFDLGRSIPRRGRFLRQSTAQSNQHPFVTPRSRENGCFPGGHRRAALPLAASRPPLRLAPGVRMSLSPGLIAAIAFAYLALLFAIAFYGDRRKAPLAPRMRGWVYSMSLAVYCTSWTFFGAVGQSTDQLWAFLPIYPGPIQSLLVPPRV